MTQRERSPYRRAVLALGTLGIDRHMLRAAAEFARLLELEMLGVFIEDRSLIDLAPLPFARELRLPGHDWQTLQPQRVAEELRAAARQIRQLFEQEIASRGVTCQFEVCSGDLATLATSVVQTTDVLIVVEPVAIDTLAPGYEPARRAALASEAAVLLLPRSGIPERGPVAAVTTGLSDASFRLASRIAAATGDKAFTVTVGSPASPAALLESLHRALGQQHERLLVLPRMAAMRHETPLEVARRRKVPVLVISAGQNQAAASV